MATTETCPRCGTTLTATQDGRLRTHGPLASRCKGSGKEAAAVKPLKRAAAKAPAKKTTVKKDADFFANLGKGKKKAPAKAKARSRSK